MPQNVAVSPQRNLGRWSPPARPAVKRRPAATGTPSTAASSASGPQAPSAPQLATTSAPRSHVARRSPTSAALPFLLRSAQLRHGDVPPTAPSGSGLASHQSSGQASVQSSGLATRPARPFGLTPSPPPAPVGTLARPASAPRPSAKRSAAPRPTAPGKLPAPATGVLHALDSLPLHPGDAFELRDLGPAAHARLAGRLQASGFIGRAHGVQLQQLHAANPELLRQLDAEGQARDIVYEAATYAFLIAAYHRAGDLQEAWAVLGRAWGHDVELAPAAYAETAEAFVRAGAWRCAMGCVEALRRQNSALPASLLAALVQALARGGHYAAAEGYVRELQQQATPPSV